MLRRNVIGIVVLAQVWTVALGAQVKDMPRTPIKSINEPRIVDINSAPESEIVAIGITGTIAKKIIDGRPYQRKDQLVSKKVLPAATYAKIKDQVIAKQTVKKGAPS